MDLVPHLAQLRRDLAAAADTGSDDAAAAAERLAVVLDPALRLLLLDVLVEAAGELTRDLAPGGVEVRLRGRDVEFVVTPAPVVGPAAAPAAAAATAAPETDADGAEEDGGTARLSLRLPERLKTRVERAADTAGLSVNAWLVRSVGEVLDGPAPLASSAPPPPALPLSSAQRHTGWVR